MGYLPVSLLTLLVFGVSALPTPPTASAPLSTTIDCVFDPVSVRFDLSDNLASAFVEVAASSLPNGRDELPNLQFRLDVFEAAELCGPTNVSINGYHLITQPRLPAPAALFESTLGRGLLPQPASERYPLGRDDLAASWSFDCLELAGVPYEQVLTLTLHDYPATRLLAYFRQTAPLSIRHIDVSTTKKIALPILQDDERYDVKAEVDPELDLHLDSALQLFEGDGGLKNLPDVVDTPQQYLHDADAYLANWLAHPNSDTAACESVGCVARTLLSRVSFLARHAVGAILGSTSRQHPCDRNLSHTQGNLTPHLHAQPPQPTDQVSNQPYHPNHSQSPHPLPPPHTSPPPSLHDKPTQPPSGLLFDRPGYQTPFSTEVVAPIKDDSSQLQSVSYTSGDSSGQRDQPFLSSYRQSGRVFPAVVIYFVLILLYLVYRRWAVIPFAGADTEAMHGVFYQTGHRAIRRRRISFTSFFRGFFCCFGLPSSRDLLVDDEEKRAILDELRSRDNTRRRRAAAPAASETLVLAVAAYESESDSDMSTTMEQDLARFRQAALVVANLVLPDRPNGFAHFFEADNYHVARPTAPPSPTNTLPLYTAYDDNPPAYTSSDELERNCHLYPESASEDNDSDIETDFEEHVRREATGASVNCLTYPQLYQQPEAESLPALREWIPVLPPTSR